MNKPFNREEAAETLGICTETIDRLRKKGKIPFHKIGDRIVFTERDLEAFLDACAVPATAFPTDREKLAMAKTVGGQNENPA